MNTCSILSWLLVPFVGITVYLLPVPFEPVGFDLPSPPFLGDALPVNNHLLNAEMILKHRILGPESLALYKDGDIYSGTAEGNIVKITPNLELSTILSLGPCEEEKECCRPLGLRFNQDGILFIIDAYLGLFQVNVTTGEKSHLVTGGKLIDNKPIIFFNDLAVRTDGVIFFSHSSTRWHRHQHLSLALEGNNDSRVLQFSPTSGKVSTLIDGLALANGVQLSKDESFLLVAEGARMRIHKYFLKGPRAGEKEIFAENLPGFVDNIRPSSRGGFWVAFPTIRKNCLYDLFAPRPWLRKLLLKFFRPEFIFHSTTKPYGLIMEFTEHGDVIRRLDDPTGAMVSYVSEVLDTGSALYLGSYSSPFLARINLISGH